MEFIDSHCHVDAADFDSDREAVIQRAIDAGVSRLIVVSAGKSVADAKRTVDFAETYKHVHPTVGIHPHNAHCVSDDTWPALKALAGKASVVAVGETGLDFYYDTCPQDRQRASFLHHIELARTVGKPLICHVRDAHQEALELLRANAAGHIETIIHCFTGTPDDAKAYVDLGFYISFSGIITFKGASVNPIRQAIRCVPPSQLLLETDCPYLAPVPMRGKRNEPAFLLRTAEILAQEAGMSLSDLSQITVDNTLRVFTLTQDKSP